MTFLIAATGEPNRYNAPRGDKSHQGHLRKLKVIWMKRECDAALSPLSRFSLPIPLEALVQAAHNQNQYLRLTKRDYNLGRSIDILPQRWIAVDTGQFLGEGGNAKVKVSTTLQGVKIAKRIQIFKDPEIPLRVIKILNEFRNKTGILDTLKMGAYKTKHRIKKFASFHPLYDQNWSETYANRPTRNDRLKMALQLLKGFKTISDKGVHRDLSLRNILVCTKEKYEAVISDLEFFKYHEELIRKIPIPFLSRQNNEAKDEVREIGIAIYCLLQNKLRRPPWIEGALSQKDLDYIMKYAAISPEEETLLRGMLAIDPEERWTAKESLEYFEKYLSSIKTP